MSVGLHLVMNDGNSEGLFHEAFHRRGSNYFLDFSHLGDDLKFEYIESGLVLSYIYTL